MWLHTSLPAFFSQGIFGSLTLKAPHPPPPHYVFAAMETSWNEGAGE